MLSQRHFLEASNSVRGFSRGTDSLVCLVVSLLLVVKASAAQVAWISSTSSQKWQQMPDPTLVKGSPQDPPEVRIAPSRTYQTIDGFGGCFNELGWVALGKATSPNRTAVLSALFSDAGCAFTLARLPIGASDFATNAYSLADTPNDYALTNFSIARDQLLLIPFVQAAMAVRPGLQCWGSPWSPPAWMKTNDSYSGGSIRWEPAVLQSYATYLARWVEAYRAAGINIYALAPQNEPNILNNYPTCGWSGVQLRDFIAGHLGPTLRDRNANVELWLGLNGDPPNGGDNFNDRLVTVLNDPRANAFIKGVGFQYDSQTQIGVASKLYPDKKLMQTETKCYSGANSWANAQDLFANMKRYFDNGANSYFMWNMVLNETGLSTWGWQQNAMVTVNSGTGAVTYNGEYYVMRHFSQYVQPGAKHVLTTGIWGDKIAFQNPDGSIVLVIGNSLGSPFGVSLTVGERSGNDTINVTLPAGSINTFVFAPETSPSATTPAVLAHRYCFNETSGTTVQDSIGGANGSLPNGGTFGGGQLSLASNSLQYVNLPAQIIDGYTSITIEAWVSFPNQLPANCSLFGFGNKSGSDGINYIFCQPRVGRIAITGSNFSGEQNANGNADFSYQLNMHLTAVFNPAGEKLELYTNGVLVAVNNTINTPMSSVNDVFSYIGRSLYNNDRYFDFSLDEFRIYNGALCADETAATQHLGPDQVLDTSVPSTSLTFSPTLGSLNLDWPAAFAGYLLQSRTNLVEGIWTEHLTFDPALIDGKWRFSLPLRAGNEFFRLQRKP
jgi:glucosylceramidase